MNIRGYTLIEMLVIVILLGAIGGTLTKLQVAQSRFVSQADATRDARAVSRSALNTLLSRLRMVEVGSGVESAAPDDITARVPYAFGIVCGNVGTVTVVSLLPVDSVTMASSTFSGWAWRDPSGDYVYQVAGVTKAPDTGATCAAESITTLSGGETVALEPQITAPPGTPMFLFQRERYQFAASAVLSGRIGLWLTPGSGTPEELAAPFDSTAHFRFFVLDADTAQNAPPVPLSDLRGLELVLTGASALVPNGDTTPKTFELTTAVFFENRRN